MHDFWIIIQRVTPDSLRSTEFVLVGNHVLICLELSSYALIQVHLSEIYFSKSQMVDTRSGGDQDIPSVIRAHIANQQNSALPPPVNQAMDPAMQQFFEAQMQLIQNLTNTVQQMQAQQNQPPQPAPPPPMDRCRMDLPGPTTSVGTRTDYSVGPWDYPTCAARYLMA
jgi:hypothetical protein